MNLLAPLLLLFAAAGRQEADPFRMLADFVVSVFVVPLVVSLLMVVSLAIAIAATAFGAALWRIDHVASRWIWNVIKRLARTNRECRLMSILILVAAVASWLQLGLDIYEFTRWSAPSPPRPAIVTASDIAVDLVTFYLNISRHLFGSIAAHFVPGVVALAATDLAVCTDLVQGWLKPSTS